MHEERLLILKMVESGKITAQEAAELLEALEEEEAPKQAKGDDVWRRIEKQDRAGG
jgi:polyhydroxyalkanoate synthesis regulator phasin